jgi:hypothetical protein
MPKARLELKLEVKALFVEGLFQRAGITRERFLERGFARCVDSSASRIIRRPCEYRVIETDNVETNDAIKRADARLAGRVMK